MKNKGWVKLLNANRWHYFDGFSGNGGVRSLCGKWMVFSVPGDADDSQDIHKDNCKECMRKRKRKRKTA